MARRRDVVSGLSPAPASLRSLHTLHARCHALSRNYPLIICLRPRRLRHPLERHGSREPDGTATHGRDPLASSHAHFDCLPGARTDFLIGLRFRLVSVGKLLLAAGR